MFERIDLNWTMVRALLGLCVFLITASVTYLGGRRLRSRLEALATSYRDGMDAALQRSELLDDVGSMGRGVYLSSRFGRYHVLSTRGILVVLVAAVACAALQQMGLALALLILMALYPYLLAEIVRMVEERRVRMIDCSLPTGASIIASSLSAGLSFQGALSAVAVNVKGPLATLARVASNALTTGSTTAEALRDMAILSRSRYVRLFATVTTVHVERGGNLAEALRTLGGAITQIILAEEELKAKTAGARKEALYATLIPVFLLPLGCLLQPDLFGKLFTTFGGIVLLVIAGSLYWYAVRKLHQTTSREV